MITKEQAKLAWANGQEVEYNPCGSGWHVIHGELKLCLFDRPDFKFRIKPRTITINGIDVPAPFEPKVGEKYWFIADYVSKGYSYTQEGTGINSTIGAWRTEEEIKQVVGALRSIFK